MASPEGQVASTVYLPADTAPWKAEGLCAQTDPDSFFPGKGEPTKEAKRTCMMCDVREQCLDEALRNREKFGVWGGLSERDRRKILKIIDARAAERAAA